MRGLLTGLFAFDCMQNIKATTVTILQLVIDFFLKEPFSKQPQSLLAKSRRSPPRHHSCETSFAILPLRRSSYTSSSSSLWFVTNQTSNLPTAVQLVHSCNKKNKPLTNQHFIIRTRVTNRSPCTHSRLYPARLLSREVRSVKDLFSERIYTFMSRKNFGSL